MDISNLFSLLCGVALFMFGMSLMGDGLKRVAGNRLELLLAKLTSTPIRGILSKSKLPRLPQSVFDREERHGLYRLQVKL